MRQSLRQRAKPVVRSEQLGKLLRARDAAARGEKILKDDDDDWSPEDGEASDDEDDAIEDSDDDILPKTKQLARRKRPISSVPTATANPTASKQAAPRDPRQRRALNPPSVEAEVARKLLELQSKVLPVKSILKKERRQIQVLDEAPVQAVTAAPAPVVVHKRPNRNKTDRVGAILGPKSATFGVETKYATSTLAQFYDEILDWDFGEAVLNDQKPLSEAPATENVQVPSKFESYQHYFSVWKPLAVQEVQAQALNGLSSDLPPALPIVCTPHASIGSTTVKVAASFNKAYSGHDKRKRQHDVADIRKDDLIVVSEDPKFLASRVHGKDGSGLLGVLGVVESQQASREGLVFVSTSARWRRLHWDASKTLYLFKVNSLVTSLREFRALCECRDYKLMQLLLSGESVPSSMRLDTLGLGYVQWLRNTFNESQQEAITAAATSQGFTLIKGPPGTGKTTTLKGLLNSLHLREYNRYYNAVLDVARRPDKDTYAAWKRIGSEKPHILVAAPSNIAVDNIVGKIIEEGFCDGEGRRYFPQIVRVGRGVTANVKSVSLEGMVESISSQPLEIVEMRVGQLTHELRIVEADAAVLRQELRNVIAWIHGIVETNLRGVPESPPPPPPMTPPPPSPQAVEMPGTPPPPPPTEEYGPSPVVSPPRPVSDMHGGPPPTSPPRPLQLDGPPPIFEHAVSFTTLEDEGTAGTKAAFVTYNSDDDDDAVPFSADDAPTYMLSEDEEDEPLPVAVTACSTVIDDDEVDEPLPQVAAECILEATDVDMTKDDEDEVDEPLPVLPPTPPRGPSPPAECAPPPPTMPDVPLVIDYNSYKPYKDIAQRINLCLERANTIRLEWQRYSIVRQALQNNKRVPKETQEQLESSFLESAHIVFTTLSSAGHRALDDSNRYDILVIDEAAQAVELSTIIPMRFGSKQCVLVGDPQQLSATVFSRTSAQSLYERSLFERLESCGHPVHMLRTQYRSHPTISAFPRAYFYGGLLQDGDNVKTPAYIKPYHSLAPAFLPLVFWNIVSSRESAGPSSRSNQMEIELAVNLYLTLRNACPPDAIRGKVGVITPYAFQMEELKKAFARVCGGDYAHDVEINTVDGYQGREKDIIILSTVRADPRKGVGFLSDIRRMNVALTRAKFACYVIGSEATLKSSKPWRALLDHTRSAQCMVHVTNPQENLLQLRPGGDPPRRPVNFGGRGRGRFQHA
ncbi:hypothetical protein SDRG_16570 [Saprolegnia diclina VS20]|uniref:Helicase ATP-binding domain-containing protein n=1 Tax=Saprolegnia diclina (strain VS20) TaxID=1156394 RepID=T0R7T3_SAPDV|nr:hypothetical protein SDRG_16570 [Saprolegnia diclina VS20]EQC25552.1 hypothetical protein SDRG_16570 [Saprolegnia diclina VS20]|eukprot:XP_008621008.1 hypothetical protein SDRG_16570 [Saprolegnia diclina VS20]